MDVHFGFRDLALPQAGGRLILGAIAPPLLPWVLACFRFDGRQNRRVNRASTCDDIRFHRQLLRSLTTRPAIRSWVCDDFNGIVSPLCRSRESIRSLALQRIGQLTPRPSKRELPGRATRQVFAFRIRAFRL